MEIYVAFKVWHDTNYYIHKETTKDLDVKWTEEIKDAKRVTKLSEAMAFFYDHLGFNPASCYDSLRLKEVIK